jgi:hypothetical protein
MTPYEFAILRYVHDAFAGELVNIGVVLWVPVKSRLLFHLSEKYEKLSNIYPDFDGAGFREVVRNLLARLKDISVEIGGEGEPSLFPSSRPPLAEILGKTVPQGTICFRWSEVYGGIASDPARRLEQLVAEAVDRERRAPRERRSDEAIGRDVQKRLRDANLHHRVAPGAVEAPNYSYRFLASWHNGTRQFAEPISLDYLNRSSILEKAVAWSGRLSTLKDGGEFQLTIIVSRPELADLQEAFQKAVAILKKSYGMRRILSEDQLDELVQEIREDLTNQP